MHATMLKVSAIAMLPLVIAAPQHYSSGSQPAHSSHEDDGSFSAQPLASFDWSEGGVEDYGIHRSCNATQTALLRQALTETETLAAHARDHIQRFGNSSAYYTRYFGTASTAEPSGWYDKLVNGDKSGVVFRCDDPDQNCATQDGYAGHWRGSNASDETVICDLSYTSRWSLTGMCGYGYTVIGGELSSYFASDLIHRLFHTDKMGEGTVFHYADTYDECLALAVEAPEEAVRNTHSLQYFALDVYAFDVANPGQGCSGEPISSDDADTNASSSTASTVSSASATVNDRVSSTDSVEDSTTTAPTSTLDAAESTTASATESAESHCHTHDGGELHCI